VNEKTIIRIAAVMAVVGLAALFFLIKVSFADSTDIGTLEGMEGKSVRVEGVVTRVNVHPEGHVFFTLNDHSGSIAVVAFAGSKIEVAYSLVEGQKLSVIGKVDVYKEKLEIIAKDITILSA